MELKPSLKCLQRTPKTQCFLRPFNERLVAGTRRRQHHQCGQQESYIHLCEVEVYHPTVGLHQLVVGEIPIDRLGHFPLEVAHPHLDVDVAPISRCARIALLVEVVLNLHQAACLAAQVECSQIALAEMLLLERQLARPPGQGQQG